MDKWKTRGPDGNPRANRFGMRMASSTLTKELPERNHDRSGFDPVEWYRTIEQAADLFDHATGRARFQHPRTLPLWSRDLLRLIRSINKDTTRRPAGFKVRSRDDPAFFLPLCVPILRYAKNRLERRCPNAERQQLSTKAWRQLHAVLAFRIIRVIRPTADELFRQVNAQSCFQPSPEIRLLDCFRQFPVAARLCAELTTDWVVATTEMLERLHRDRAQILKNLCGRPNMGLPLVSEVKQSGGDPHRHGRSVCVVTFRNRSRVVYKPRACNGEWEWAQAMMRIQSRGVRARSAKILRRTSFGWSEFIVARPCRTKAAAQAFFRRIGGIVCLSDILGLVDLHQENLIASGAQPVPIDLETMCHFEDAKSIGQDEKLPRSSLERSGLLPSKAFENTSALKAKETPFNRQSRYLPRLAGENLSPAKFIESMEEGFRRAATDLLNAGRNRRAFEKQFRRITHKAWRKIHAPTEWYFSIGERSLHPSLMTSGLSRSRWLLNACARPSASHSVVLQEVAALARLDIPYFRTVTPRKDLVLPTLEQMLQKLPELRASFD